MTDATTAGFPADHYLGVADAYARGGNWAGAAEVARRGVADHPDDGRLWAALGTAAWAADDFPTAVYALETAGYLVPLRPLARLALADGYLAAAAVGKARPLLRELGRGLDAGDELLSHVAGRLCRAGAYRRAARVWRRVLRRRPGYAEGHYRYALCLFALGAGPEDLFVPLHEAVLLAPGVPRYALSLANVWAGLGEFRDAAEVLDTLAPARVGCPACLVRMTALYRLADRPADAAACERRLTEMTPATTCRG